MGPVWDFVGLIADKAGALIELSIKGWEAIFALATGDWKKIPGLVTAIEGLIDRLINGLKPEEKKNASDEWIKKFDALNDSIAPFKF